MNWLILSLTIFYLKEMQLNFYMKKIRSIIKLLNPNNNDIQGTPLNNEQEIIDLFYSKKGLEIKKQDGVIWEVMPKNPQRYGQI